MNRDRAMWFLLEVRSMNQRHQPLKRIDMQNIKLYPDALGQNLHFNQLLRGFMCTLQFEKHKPSTPVLRAPCSETKKGQLMIL